VRLLSACAVVGLAGSTAFAADMAGFAPVDLGGHQPLRAATAMSLLEPLIRNHPERLEGRPTLTIDLRREGDGLVATVEMGGLLDDSVEARQFRALIGRRDEQWELQALGQRQRCARGLLGMTGAWATARCS
jgi:hypothetical protein